MTTKSLHVKLVGDGVRLEVQALWALGAWYGNLESSNVTGAQVDGRTLTTQYAQRTTRVTRAIGEQQRRRRLTLYTTACSWLHEDGLAYRSVHTSDLYQSVQNVYPVACRKRHNRVLDVLKMSGEAWLYLLAVLLNAVNLFLQVFFTIMYSDLEWCVESCPPRAFYALLASAIEAPSFGPRVDTTVY